MAKVVTDDSHYKAIADTVREFYGTPEDVYRPSDMANGVRWVAEQQHENGYFKGFDEGYTYGEGVGSIGGYAEGYEDGYDKGHADGVKSEYDLFWDALQGNGSGAIDYRYKFFYWPDEAYNPKYPIRSTKTSMTQVFGNARITNTRVDVDFSGTTTCSQAFMYCSLLHTIPKLIVSEKNTFGNAFQNCSALVNITVDGMFGNSVGFQWSTLLSKESITSIINALSGTASGQSVTFSQTAVNNAFTTDEWATLVATKPNWTISLM